MSTRGKEVCFDVDGLRYAGLAWGANDKPLILALHGWLDNALSFSVLAPLLDAYRVVALDLSGHGLSSHRSPDATYNIWDDLPQLRCILDRLGHEPLVIMGHSRGASIAMQLATIIGDRCHRLIALDGLLPAWFDGRDAAEQLGRFVTDSQRYREGSPRFFPSVDDFIERRRQYGFTDDSARLLAPRALEQGVAGFRMRHDPRLYGASACSLGPAARKELYASIQTPTLAIVADQGIFQRSETAQLTLKEARQFMRHLRVTGFEGTHHLHMDHDVAPLLVSCIQSFIESGV